MMIGTVSIAYDATRFQSSCPACSPSESTTGQSAKNDSSPLKSDQSTGTAPEQERTQEEKIEIAELKKRDREVKVHEAAHMAAGGGIVRGGASYSYQTGPDGKRYAVGGEVSIDTSSGDNPRATIRKMQAVRKAALAPANPSGQDRSVAAAASAQEAQARQKLNTERSSEGATGDHPTQKPRVSGARMYTAQGTSQSTLQPSPEVDIAG